MSIERFEDDEGNLLEMPALNDWGSEVKYNGNIIPASRLWELAGAFLTHGKKVPKELLFAEAKRADIYRLFDAGQIIWTTQPRADDIPFSPERNVYVRKDKQRVRVFLAEFNIKLAKIEEQPNKMNILELVEVCKENGLYPVAAQEHRFYFTPDPQRVFEAFGTTDHLRLAVYLKRPSSGGIKIRL
jgi:hypothetical protein